MATLGRILLYKLNSVTGELEFHPNQGSPFIQLETEAEVQAAKNRGVGYKPHSGRLYITPNTETDVQTSSRQGNVVAVGTMLFARDLEEAEKFLAEITSAAQVITNKS